MEQQTEDYVTIKAPGTYSESEYFNYIIFSIVLLAVVDRNYCFWYSDIGANVFSETLQLGKSAIDNDYLNLPEKGYFFADDAFPLTKYIMKPHCSRKKVVKRTVYLCSTIDIRSKPFCRKYFWNFVTYNFNYR